MSECEVLVAAGCEPVLWVRDPLARATVLVAGHRAAPGRAHGGRRRWQDRGGARLLQLARERLARARR
jgi:hypothetical protein